MNYTRRDLSKALALLTAVKAQAGTAAMPSHTWRYEDLPAKEKDTGAQRAVFKGETHTGFPVELHETELAPGKAPHPPHSHVHEEMIIIREGTMEVTISGKSSRLGPGSVAWVASGEHHGWRNVGTTRARYMVMALGRDK